MSEPRLGYRYRVNSEQLRVFRMLTPSQRLGWLEEMLSVTCKLAPQATKLWWRKFRDHS